MPAVRNQQTVDDILRVIEAAQRQGRSLQVRSDRVELGAHAASSSASRGARNPSPTAPQTSDAAVARAVREAILRRIDEGLVGGTVAIRQGAALRRTVMALHQQCGPNELPVARYRALLDDFRAGAAVGLTGADILSGTQPNASPRLSFDQANPASVHGLLTRLGPAANSVRGLLDDYDHVLRHTLMPPADADRSQAAAQLLTQLSHLMERFETLSARDLRNLPGATMALTLLRAGVEAEVELIAQALTLGAAQQGPITWRAALDATQQQRAGMPVAPAASAPSADDTFVERPTGDPTGTPWGKVIDHVCKGRLAGEFQTTLANGGAQVADAVRQKLQDEYETARRHLVDFARDQGRQLLKQAAIEDDPVRAEAFRQRHSALIDQVLANHIDVPELLRALVVKVQGDGSDDNAPAYRLGRALLDAQHALRAGLEAMHAEYVGETTSSRRPQVTAFSDGLLGPVRFAVVQPAPAVENLVLGGGGMKSTGISAALQAYDEAGLLAGVKKIAGNSAGAITGGVLACGWPLEDLPKLNTQMSNFSAVFSPLDSGHRFRTMYPNLTLGVTAVSHAARLLRAMDFQTATAVQKWLHQNEDELRRAMRSRRVTMAEVQQLDRLRRQDLNGSNREAQMVTFRDLEILHRISPERFKLLSVTAYDSARQTNHTFDVDSNPYLPIAYAARASMAAPVAFTSVTIEGTRYLDGGFGANVPVDVIHGDKSGEALDQSRARTLLLAYESLGETNSSLHEKAPEPGWTQPLSDLIFRVLGQAAHARAELADRQRVWDTGPQTAVVHHGDLNTFDFGASPERVAFAVSHSRVMAQEQVALRRQQAFHTVYERPEQVVAALDTKAREEIIRQLEALEQLTGGLDDPILSARGELLSLLRAGQNSLAE